MCTVYDWHTNDAGLSFRASMYGRTYEQEIKKYRAQSYHMRIGRFAVVVVGNECIAAQVYDNDLCDDGSITRESKFWETSKRDRFSQHDRVLGVLKSTHPYCSELLRDIVKEQEFRK